MTERSGGRVKLKKHIGVYAIVRQESNLLLIKKTRGPYEGLFDLPGGEVYEETNVKVLNVELLDAWNHTVEYTSDEGNLSMYHIGLIYTVKAFENTKLLQNFVLEDSAGAEWVDTNQVDKHSLSPFALKAVVIL
jgi:ADP-ribose pyrophosphatase YjhB (NUDIX family)